VNFREQSIIFPCNSEELLGVLAIPERASTTGLIIVVGGPQYRAGSHRQFLLLSRALSEAGYPAMRFDFRGMGDSTGESRDFDARTEDISAAIDTFIENCPQLERIILWGLCDAASASLLYWDATHDPRVNAMVLLNPWVRSEATLARTHIKHYYGQRILQTEFWRKLLTGKLGIYRAVGGLVANWRRSKEQAGENALEQTPPFQRRMMRALVDFPGEILLILSGDDYTAKEFIESVKADPVVTQVLLGNRVTRIDVEGADHTFSSAKWRQAVQEITSAWIEESAAM